MEANAMEETTIGAIFESLAERVSFGRTLALMGERASALKTLQQTEADYLEFREALSEFPGRLSLEHSLSTTIEGLQHESRLSHIESSRSATQTRRRALKRRISS